MVVISAGGATQHRQRKTMQTKMKSYFENWKQACDYCHAHDVSNEIVQYEPATNRYLVLIDDHGKTLGILTL